MKYCYTFITLILMLCLSGCLPVTLAKKNNYVLSPQPILPKSKKHSRKTLLVMSVETNDALDTTRMAYVNQAYQLAYFTRHAWAATPASQLTAIITRSLQHLHYYKAVVSTPFVGVTDLKLNVFLYKFQQNFLVQPSQEQLELTAQLINANSGKIIKEKTFSYAVKTHADTPYGGVLAANQAVRQFIYQLAKFVRLC